MEVFLKKMFPKIMNQNRKWIFVKGQFGSPQQVYWARSPHITRVSRGKTYLVSNIYNFILKIYLVQKIFINDLDITIFFYLFFLRYVFYIFLEYHTSIVLIFFLGHFYENKKHYIVGRGLKSTVKSTCVEIESVRDVTVYTMSNNDCCNSRYSKEYHHYAISS